MSSHPTIVPIDMVIPEAGMNPGSAAVRRMAEVLKRQGQIEPLQVKVHFDKYVTFHQDAHGQDIVHAARFLGWPTLLVVEMNRFEY